MAISPITEGLPGELTMQLLGQEQVYYFSYISFTGGCGSSSSRENYWIALTNKRVLYKTKILEGNQKYVERDGIVPLDKVSFIEVSEGQIPSGCSTAKAYQLRISSSGGTSIIPIPTKEKGYEIRKVYSEIIELVKQQ
jgi:hypothetical protein